MPIRAVVVDIDGTMTDYEKRLDLAGVRAIRAVERRGIPVIVATGNVAPVTKAFCDYVGTSGQAICENGGVVCDRTFAKRKLLASRRYADRAVGALRRRGFDARYLSSDPWRESEVALELNLDLQDVQKVLRRWRLTVLSTKFALHLMDPSLDKLRGLKQALRLSKDGARPNDILAIGDSNNDVNLLRGCGYSGVVRNATPTAQGAAQYWAKRDHGEGVREILDHFGVV